MNFMYFPATVDEHGNQVQRTKNKYPNSYDGFVTYGFDFSIQGKHTVYSYRLAREGEKANRLIKKHLPVHGDNWGNVDAGSMEQFLREYLNDDSIEVVRIMEYCKSDGNPYWRFDYK